MYAENTGITIETVGPEIKNEGKINMIKPIARTYMVCEYCSKKGHTIHKCYKKKNEDKRNKRESYNSGKGYRPQE